MRTEVDLFTTRLKELRTSANLTQKQAADMIKLPPATWQKYESGERIPTLGKAALLADLFAVSLDYLAGRSDNPSMH